MGKAVLIIDMPNSCLECEMGFSGTYGGIYCEVLKKFCCGNLIYSKEKDCPLKELPEKRKYNEEFFNGDVKGWNDCLKTILGE